MAIPQITNRVLDTMVSTALDTYSKDPINALTDSGEKFLKAAASQGRVFVVNDAEAVRHPIMYDGGEDSTLYTPDNVDGVQGNLSEEATEILTHCRFELQAGTRNINFPQSQPPGNLIDYVSNVVKANMMEILNEEEILFVRGRASRDLDPASISVLRGAFPGDGSYTAGIPTSLGGVLYNSSTPSPTADGTTTDEAYAAIKTNDVAKWQPYHVQATGTDHGGLFGDLQKAILYATYSETERPTHVYVALDTFEKMLDLLRESAALPDPVRTDMGKEGTIAFGGITMDWSRYLRKEATWDVIEPEAGTDSYPILGVNWNSLRLNTVRAGGIGDGSIGFIRQIGEMQPHPLKTNLFKRIEWKRQWSVDNGRRSFFTIYGNTTV
ncbi:MAG: hypothetical protein JSV86_08685 [Gemmatimonadota bacterium]|nr:MAG: hypothetical protein JSV86_08685 [Gemmatimonadota bacterium]